MNFFSPLEQFDILPIIPFVFNSFDISITNETVILALGITGLFFSIVLTRCTDTTLPLIPTKHQIIFEIIYNLISSLIKDNIVSNNREHYFPIVVSIFFFISLLNSIGLIPYSFTLTSHIIITFALSFAIYVGINIICIKKFGLLFFSLFLPSGTSFVLALLLVPIELISYLFKPISLSIRLFANMMAGHTLLKVIAGFASDLMYTTGLSFIIHIVPLLILLPLFGLELSVALIQSFVFSILICIYINDALNFH
jgi:F-type H+-transporting ATPase subunit a